VVSAEDASGIYNASTATQCTIANAEILVEGEVIDNYDEIKDTDEFIAQLEQMKSSYGIYNNSAINTVIDTTTITVERLKGIGIRNSITGQITLGNNTNAYNATTPIISAIEDHTTAIVNDTEGEQKGVINMYDGKIESKESIKAVITNVLDNYEIIEENVENVINTYLSAVESGIESIEEVEKLEGVEEVEVEDNEITEELENIKELENIVENENLIENESTENNKTVENTEEITILEVEDNKEVEEKSKEINIENVQKEESTEDENIEETKIGKNETMNFIIKILTKFNKNSKMYV